MGVERLDGVHGLRPSAVLLLHDRCVLGARGGQPAEALSLGTGQGQAQKISLAVALRRGGGQRRAHAGPLPHEGAAAHGLPGHHGAELPGHAGQQGRPDPVADRVHRDLRQAAGLADVGDHGADVVLPASDEIGVPVERLRIRGAAPEEADGRVAAPRQQHGQPPYRQQGQHLLASGRLAEHHDAAARPVLGGVDPCQHGLSAGSRPCGLSFEHLSPKRFDRARPRRSLAPPDPLPLPAPEEGTAAPLPLQPPDVVRPDTTTGGQALASTSATSRFPSGSRSKPSSSGMRPAPQGTRTDDDAAAELSLSCPLRAR